MKYLINFRKREIVYMAEEPDFSLFIADTFGWRNNGEMKAEGYEVAVSV